MKVRNHSLCSLIIFLSISIDFCSTQINTISGKTIAVEEVDSFLQVKMQELKIPGLSIAVINDQELVYERSLGVSNAQSKSPVDTRTIFETASITKPLFAYFVMRMVEKGVLNLDVPLASYLPNPDLDYDPRYKLITARQVLSHTSGLPNWRYMTNKMMYLELLSNPGEKFGYSGEGYEYLANVIAHLEGRNLAALDSLLQAEVLQPLGMKSSYFTWNDEMDRYKAHGHVLPNVANDRWEPLIARVAGGLHSNARDFARFISWIMRKEGLSDESYREMLSPHVDLPVDNEIRSTFEVEQWTLGFAKEGSQFGDKFSHGGNNGDFQSYFEFYPDQGIGYVFMTNSNKGNELNTELKQFLTLGYLPKSDRLYECINRSVSLTKDMKEGSLSLNKGSGAGFAWLKNETILTGSIDFDVRGEDLRNKSFVGLAFNAKDEEDYESIYFRPYLFQSEATDEKAFMVQYISMPKHDWFDLRSASPGTFEGEIASPPKSEEWFHVKVEIGKEVVQVFVDHEITPSLRINRLKEAIDGRIGFWVGNGSQGDFANLNISKD